jgi:hypothetical protein
MKEVDIDSGSGFTCSPLTADLTYGLRLTDPRTQLLNFASTTIIIYLLGSLKVDGDQTFQRYLQAKSSRKPKNIRVVQRNSLYSLSYLLMQLWLDLFLIIRIAATLKNANWNPKNVIGLFLFCAHVQVDFHRKVKETGYLSQTGSGLSISHTYLLVQ